MHDRHRIQPKKLLLASPLVMLIFSYQAKAELIDIGNGLIYDSTNDVTWISDGHAFTNDIAATTSNPTAGPYTGPLLGKITTPQKGGSHTIVDTDIPYIDNLFRWLGSWYGARAWAENLSYQFGDRQITHWRLPTKSEAQSLSSQLGQWGAVPPFTWVPPVIWTSDEPSETTATFVNFLNNSTAVKEKDGPSNVWAVRSGNVATTHAPVLNAIPENLVAGSGHPLVLDVSALDEDYDSLIWTMEPTVAELGATLTLGYDKALHTWTAQLDWLPNSSQENTTIDVKFTVTESKTDEHLFDSKTTSIHVLPAGTPLDPSNPVSKVTITRARYDKKSHKLLVRGRVTTPKKTNTSELTVRISDPITGAFIGTAWIGRSGSWQFNDRVSVVPCTVQAEHNNLLDVGNVANPISPCN